MSAETTRRQWLIFLLLAVAQFMVVLDVSITNIALPSIMQELGFAANDLQWVLTAYALSFGGFLLFGGRASDLFGRKRVLLIGISAFTIISLLIGFSVSPLMLIVLRALQGVAAALMTPAALSIVLVTFEEQSARNQALGFWSLVATGGAAAGLLLGGALTQYLSWRWDFFVNVGIRPLLGRRVIRKLAIALTCLLLVGSLWGGGIAAYVIRSTDTWYWPSGQPVSQVVRSAVWPLVIR